MITVTQQHKSLGQCYAASDEKLIKLLNWWNM